MKPHSSNSSGEFTQRKKDHIEISLREESQSYLDQFSKIQLQHCAVPEINFDEVSTQCEVFGHPLKTPLFVSSMTLGHGDSATLNQKMAKLCEQRGWMMGVGSQRRQLFDSTAYQECEKLRSQFSDLVLFGNIGLSQAIQTPVEKLQSLVASLGAQFLVIHTNPMQEAIQPEGTPEFAQGLKSITEICKKMSVPVVLKETGCGFSSASFEKLWNSGLAAVDVSGRGGTHWGRVEGLRMSPEDLGYQIAQTFADWGLSTVDSVTNGLKSSYKGEIWGSGGVHNGLDAAKLLVLGASKVGFARLILQAVIQGEESLEKVMERLEIELKVAMFCLGCKDLKTLIGNRELVKWK